MESIMPIIKSKQKQERAQIRISIESEILDVIKQYCDWAGVKKQDEFFEEAAKYLLSKDRDWKNHISQKETA
jgi:hypothetical protein